VSYSFLFWQQKVSYTVVSYTGMGHVTSNRGIQRGSVMGWLSLLLAFSFTVSSAGHRVLIL
jgi:hypothetical protein